MHPEMALLYALHEVDARILQLERAIRGLDNGDRAKAALTAARQELAGREDALKRARVAMGEAETALKANEAKQAQLGKRLYGGSITSQREAEAVEAEIAALKKGAGDLETTILETMDVIESGEAAVKEQTAVVAAREKALADTVASYAKDLAALKAQHDQATAKREAVVAPVTPGVLARYDSARRRTKDTGLTVLEGNTCSACRMQVAGISLAHLASSEDLIACDNCGRLLYRRA